MCMHLQRVGVCVCVAVHSTHAWERVHMSESECTCVCERVSVLIPRTCCRAVPISMHVHRVGVCMLQCVCMCVAEHCTHVSDRESECAILRTCCRAVPISISKPKCVKGRRSESQNMSTIFPLSSRTGNPEIPCLRIKDKASMSGVLCTATKTYVN